MPIDCSMKRCLKYYNQITNAERLYILDKTFIYDQIGKLCAKPKSQ